MTKNLDKEGLRSIVNNYDVFYIDIWGVVHNGLRLHDKAIEVLLMLTEIEKKFVLLTNAPRPIKNVKIQLEKLGMKAELRDHVYTSGEASIDYLSKNLKEKKFFHIGPPKDFDLFYDFKNQKTDSLVESDLLLCTGLFENESEDLKFYKDLLEKNIKKKMICTNPDLIVDKGDKRELCAGSVAMVFEKVGGTVIYFGKPYQEIYNQAAENKNKKVLCIGDNLNTDIKGANLQNFDSLIISNGIHKNEIIKYGIDKLSKSYESIPNYIQSELKW